MLYVNDCNARVAYFAQKEYPKSKTTTYFKQMFIGLFGLSFKKELLPKANPMKISDRQA